MKSIKYYETNSRTYRRDFSVWSLALAGALGLVGAGASMAVHAQETSTTVFGQAPAGGTIIVHSITSGIHRHGSVNAKGRYSIGSLPPGVYSITLEKEGKAIDTRDNIPLLVGRGAEVDFACDHDQCAAPAGG